jgi:hypothetical protein
LIGAGAIHKFEQIGPFAQIDQLPPDPINPQIAD